MICLQAQAAGAGGAAAPAGGAAGGGALDFLRTNPQFQALRQIVQANPQILQPMLQVASRCIHFLVHSALLSPKPIMLGKAAALFVMGVDCARVVHNQLQHI